MIAEKFLVAGGNPTLLVWDCPPDKQELLSQLRLGSGGVEQVGFVTHENGVTYLTMMGNELCINAALALASMGGADGAYFTRGIDYLVSYTNDDRATNDPPGEGMTHIQIRLPFRQEGETVLFDGIGYACYDEKIAVNKEEVIGLAKKYRLPAFGIIERKENTITPHVYVADTGFLINESACGSGSIAANITFGLEDIIQPSGETIRVKRTGDRFAVSARVRKVRDYVSTIGINLGNSGRATN